MDYRCDYIDIADYDLTDYDITEIYKEEDLPKGLLEFCVDYGDYAYDGVLEYDNVGYQDAVFNKFLELFNAEIKKEIPELILTQEKSGSEWCEINDELLIDNYYDKHKNDKDFNSNLNNCSAVLEYIIEKLNINCRDLDEKAVEAIDKKDYVSINIKSLNEMAKFEPEIDSIEEFIDYKFDHIEDIDDEEIPVYVWIGDAEGQQKLPLQYENLNRLINEALK